MANGPRTYDLAEENTSANYSEEVKVDDRSDRATRLHGDIGLALVGDERIPLTDEDVRCACFWILEGD